MESISGNVSSGMRVDERKLEPHKNRGSPLTQELLLTIVYWGGSTKITIFFLDVRTLKPNSCMESLMGRAIGIFVAILILCKILFIALEKCIFVLHFIFTFFLVSEVGSFKGRRAQKYRPGENQWAISDRNKIILKKYVKFSNNIAEVYNHRLAIHRYAMFY